jgi:CheY-specific phosphatase CheX
MQLHLLLVAPADSAIVGSTQTITNSGPRILRSEGVAEATALVESTPMLAMVVVDRRIGDADAVLLVDGLKKTHPDLPLLWMGDGWEDTDELEGRRPDGFVAAHADVDSLEGHAKRLLREQLYEESTVELVRTSAEAVLRESFRTSATAGDPCLKANRHTMAPITAIVSFHGASISGQLVVSGRVEHLAEIWRRVLPKRPTVSTDQLEDIAGEIANQTLGRIKSFFVRQGQPFDVSSPVFVRGDTVEIRYKVDRPSLLFALQDPEGTLYVQFCFDSYDPERREDAEDALEPGGEVTFL